MLYSPMEEAWKPDAVRDKDVVYLVWEKYDEGLCSLVREDLRPRALAFCLELLQFVAYLGRK